MRLAKHNEFKVSSEKEQKLRLTFHKFCFLTFVVIRYQNREQLSTFYLREKRTQRIAKVEYLFRLKKIALARIYY